MRSADVVVIGSGIVGCAVAYELGCRGAAVLVLDDRPAGMGATHASAGMLAPYNEVDEPGPHLDLTVRGLDDYDAFMARVHADAGHDVPYHRTGTLTLAFSGPALERLAGLADRLRVRRVPVELITGPVDGVEPEASPDALGGLLIASHGFVVAADLTRALVAAARRRGVRFAIAPRVREIHGAGAGDAVEVSNGVDTWAAGHAINAAGSWAGQLRLAGAEAAPLVPVRGQLLHLKATGANLRRVTWGDNCYLVPWDDGSLLVGATSEHVGFDEHTTIGGMRELLAGVTATLRADWQASVVGVRAGLRPGTPDGLPIVGRSTVAPGVWYATGHYRNGILLAPVTARLLVDALLDGRTDPLLEATSPARFGRL